MDVKENMGMKRAKKQKPKNLLDDTRELFQSLPKSKQKDPMAGADCFWQAITNKADRMMENYIAESE